MKISIIDAKRLLVIISSFMLIYMMLGCATHQLVAVMDSVDLAIPSDIHPAGQITYPLFSKPVVTVIVPKVKDDFEVVASHLRKNILILTSSKELSDLSKIVILIKDSNGKTAYKEMISQDDLK